MPSDIDIPFRHSNASITSKLKKGTIIIKQMGGENKSVFFFFNSQSLNLKPSRDKDKQVAALHSQRASYPGNQVKSVSILTAVSMNLVF